MQKFLDFIRIIVDPRLWYMVHPYSKGWDTFLNRAIEAGNKFQPGPFGDTRHIVKLHGQEVWIANYPYGAFVSVRLASLPYVEDEALGSVVVRPSRMTILRLRRKLREHLG